MLVARYLMWSKTLTSYAVRNGAAARLNRPCGKRRVSLTAISPSPYGVVHFAA